MPPRPAGSTRSRDGHVFPEPAPARHPYPQGVAVDPDAPVQLGDPVVVYGRLYSRDWVDDQGNRRTSYELDALTIGHDLNRGVDKFARRKPAASTDMVEDSGGVVALGGEPTEPIGDPGRPDDLPPDNELFEGFDPSVYETSPIVAPSAEEQPLAGVRS